MSDDDKPDEENEIVVVADRPDDGGGGGGGGGFWGGFWGGDFFDFNPPMGGGGGGTPPPDDDPDEDNEIVVTAPRPSDDAPSDQSDFADDGDIFNDGEAPRYDTLIDWLNDLIAQGLAADVEVEVDAANRDVYTGRYTDIAGNEVVFSSNGEDLYFQGTIEVPPPPPPPIDPNEIASNDWGGPGYDFY